MVRKEIWKEIFLGGSPVELAINYCIRCKLTSKNTTYMKKVLGVLLTLDAAKFSDLFLDTLVSPGFDVLVI